MQKKKKHTIQPTGNPNGEPIKIEHGPIRCPSCDAPMIWDRDEKAYECTNIDCRYVMRIG